MRLINDFTAYTLAVVGWLLLSPTRLTREVYFEDRSFLNYRGARYAMAVYLNQEAKQETNLAQKQKLIHQAQGSLTYILNFINQNDKQASELLENIK
jgi:hypothetical protein